MANVTELLILVGSIFVFIMIGMPVWESLAISGAIGLAFMLPQLQTISPSSFMAMIQSMFSGITQYTLLAIPLFMFAGELMNAGGITDKLIKFAMLLIGRLPGSLAHANIVASMFFGGITGSAQADTTCIGGIMIPAMIKQGYSKEVSVAVTAASSTCGPIIPPSTMMIIFAVAVNASVGALFMGGVVPGILIGLAEMAVVALQNIRYHFPRTTEVLPWSVKKQIIKDAIIPLGMPVIIVGGIVTGVCTATEAGAMAILYAIITSVFVTKTLKFKDIVPLALKSAIGSAGAMMIISAAKIVAYSMTTLGVGKLVADLFLSISSSPYVFLLLVNILLLIMGMFMDGGASVIIFAPILTPIAVSLGISPIHFGLVMVLNLVIGLGTPPLGVCMFIACAIADLPIVKGAKAMMPYVAAEIIVLLAITYIPDLVLFIPRLLGYAV